MDSNGLKVPIPSIKTIKFSQEFTQESLQNIKKSMVFLSMQDKDIGQFG
jgi:hypothetical protein